MILLEEKEIIDSVFEDDFENFEPLEFEFESLDDSDIDYGKDDLILDKLLYNQLISDFNLDNLIIYIKNPDALRIVDWQGYRFEIHGKGSYFYIKDREDVFLFDNAKEMIKSLQDDDYDLSKEERRKILNLSS